MDIIEKPRGISHNIMISLLLLIICFHSPLFSQDKTVVIVNGEKYSYEQFMDYIQFKQQMDPNYHKKENKEILNDFAVNKIILGKVNIESPDLLKINKESAILFRDSMINVEMDFYRIEENELREAYYHLSHARNVNHIQVNLPEFPYPADTLEAYKKIQEIYQLLEDGENFAELAYQYSENPLTRRDSGNLGSIVFGTLTYPMEWQSYSTAINKFSEPFMAWQGYHIMKVNDESIAPGSMEIAHILKYLPDDRDSLKMAKLIIELDSIRNLIVNGENFWKYTSSYSDDSNTKYSGGRLGFVTPFGLNQELGKAAFQLKKDGEISPVVQIKDAISIIKRISYAPVPGFTDAKDSLKQVLLLNSSRKLYLKKQFYDHLKRQINFVANPENIEEFLMLGKNNFYNGQWTLPEGTLANKTLFSINGEPYSFMDLSLVMKNTRYAHRVRNFKPVVWKQYSDFEESKINEFVKKNPDVAFPEINKKYMLFKEELVVEEYIKKELLSTLNYDTKTLKKEYKKNRKLFKESNNSEKNKTFDEAFPEILQNYQKTKTEKWKRKLIKQNKIQYKK